MQKSKFSKIEKLSKTLIRTQTPIGRYYITPNGPFPSATTILSYKKNDGLQRWIDRVGEDIAQRVMEMAADRGHNLHQALEKYIITNKVPIIKSHLTREMFLNIKKYLDNNVKKYIFVEIPLYSKKLRLAGTIDLVAVLLDGVIYIIDFKSSRNIKKEEYIQEYFEQASIYGIFLYSHGIKVRKFKILISNIKTGELQIFEGNIEDHIKSVIEKRKKFAKIEEDFDIKKYLTSQGLPYKIT